MHILSIPIKLFTTGIYAKNDILESLIQQQLQLDIYRKSNIIIFIAIIIAILNVTLLVITIKMIKNKNQIKKDKQIEVKRNDTNYKENDNNLEHVMELAKDNDPGFLSKFRDTYPLFYDKLISLHENITTTDIKLCAMTYINISTRDIAEYTSVCTRTVQTRRNRFRKKINLDPRIDLFVFLHSL